METIVRDEYEWKYANQTTGGGDDENDEALPPPKKKKKKHVFIIYSVGCTLTAV